MSGRSPVPEINPRDINLWKINYYELCSGCVIICSDLDPFINKENNDQIPWFYITLLWLINKFFPWNLNVPTVSNKQNFYSEIIFCWHLESHWRNSRVRIRIRNPVVWIRIHQITTFPEHWLRVPVYNFNDFILRWPSWRKVSLGVTLLSCPTQGNTLLLSQILLLLKGEGGGGQYQVSTELQPFGSLTSRVPILCHCQPVKNWYESDDNILHWFNLKLWYLIKDRFRCWSS